MGASIGLQFGGAAAGRGGTLPEGVTEGVALEVGVGLVRKETEAVTEIVGVIVGGILVGGAVGVEGGVVEGVGVEVAEGEGQSFREFGIPL
jgi:hypothetical protein